MDLSRHMVLAGGRFKGRSMKAVTAGSRGSRGRLLSAGIRGKELNMFLRASACFVRANNVCLFYNVPSRSWHAPSDLYQCLKITTYGICFNRYVQLTLCLLKHEPEHQHLTDNACLSEDSTIVAHD